MGAVLNWLADVVVYRLLGLEPDTHLASALHFFIYDTIKILIMLAVIIFAVSVVRSFFPPEKTRAILSRRHQYAGNILAALLGIVTPFLFLLSSPGVHRLCRVRGALGGDLFLSHLLAHGK